MDNYTVFLNIINLIFVVNIAFAIIVIIFEKRNTSNTWTWLMIMLFIPFIGFIMYLFFGQNLRRKKFFVLKKEEESVLMQFSEEQKRLLSDKAIVNNNSLLKEYHDVINLNLYSDNFIVTNNNKVDILNNGNEKFPIMIDCIKNAKNFIHIQYYTFNDDNLGTEILNLLVEKAKEGIEVKLLYDGMGCIHNKKHFFDPLIKVGGEVYCFFPPFIPYINVRINYRNHRKICVVDGEHGFVGGLNVGDEYLGLSKKFGFWRDTHLHLQGDSVNYLEVRFLMDWRFASKKDFFMEEKYFPRKQYIDNTAVQIISSGPDSEWCSIRNTYLKLINKAENSIYIETPYFIPDDSILTALKIACLSGVDVKIIIPCKPDHPFIYWASKSYIWELVECGAKCYTYDNGFIHSKMVSVDGKMCTIGTANMDIRSFNLNFEVNAIIYGTKTTSVVDKAFEADILQSTLLTPEHYSNRSLIIKFKEAISRLLSPIL
ncbi:cardiolipin synthase [Clostridium sp. UBA1353]|uniref:cardiolipin synthase n=1 Tax=Clostridium sp. UBA1353 TaxID=1946347 RepID=UPI003216C3E3